ncbi:hypothetical protein WIS52_29490 [Pseudonocardia nematodicida]|uniref:Uncharacterized protein n=1 Tax=Pseudonocardia nematodicida TaxID=1206997 RepID=A0ABV1KJJ0_9PSEU
MTTMHVVYRVHDEGRIGEDWSTYSFPDGVFAGGPDLEPLRSEVRRSAEELAGTAVSVVEHIERPAGPDIYVRGALDDRAAERADVIDAVRASSLVRGERTTPGSRFPLAASGDSILVACLPEDTLSWVLEQMDAHDAVAVCAVGPSLGTGRFVYVNYLAREAASPAGRDESDQSIAEAGLSPDSTVAEFVRATITAGRRGLRLSPVG